MLLRLLGCIFSFAFLVSCSSGDSAGGLTDLSNAFPEDLALSSPTAQSSSSFTPARSANGFISMDADDSAETKKALLEDIITATAGSCAVNLDIINSTNADCYGPNLTYAGHTEDGGGPAAGTLPGGDLGIWEASTDGEACSAAQLNQRIKGVASQVDAGMFAVAGMICVAATSGIALPAESASVDLTAAMASKLTINSSAATVTAAALARDADVGGFPVYVSTITATVGTSTYNFRMKHVLTSSDESTYGGKVTISIANADGTKPQNCSASSETGYTDATSIIYEKTSATDVAYELKSAQFCGDSADPYNSTHDYTVDLTKELTGGLQTGWANNANYMKALLDPSTLAGTYQYAWQAGMGDSHARVFNLKIDPSGTSAEAFFGFGNDMSNVALGEIDGMICNWAGPGSSHTPTGDVQSQTMTLTGGVWVAGTSHITYDPVNDCESTLVGLTLDWNISGPVSTTADLTTMDLGVIADVTAAIPAYPSAPSDVD